VTVLATIRAVETWTTANIVGGVVLLAIAAVATVVAIRVALRR
jgi:hypothetical protein